MYERASQANVDLNTICKESEANTFGPFCAEGIFILVSLPFGCRKSFKAAQKVIAIPLSYAMHHDHTHMAKEHIEYLAFHIWHTVLCMHVLGPAHMFKCHPPIRLRTCHVCGGGVSCIDIFIFFSSSLSPAPLYFVTFLFRQNDLM